MIEIIFYEIMHNKSNYFLARILNLFYEKNQKVLLINQDLGLMEEIDLFLWTYSSKVFLPHDTINGKFLEKQSVLLSLSDSNIIKNNPNSAEILIFYNSLDILSKDYLDLKYNNLIYIFSGLSKNHVDFARENWKNYKSFANLYHHKINEYEA